MDVDRARRLVELLRRKAASTTFPEEAKTLRERASLIEAKYKLLEPAPAREPLPRPWLRSAPVVRHPPPGGLYMDMFRRP